MTDEEKELKKLKILLIVLGIILVILIILRIIFGRMYFTLPYMYYNKSNEYMFYVNGEHQNISFEDYDDTPIIPGILYFRRMNMGGWYNTAIYDQELFFEDEKIVFDFKAYECYTHTDEIRVNCDSFNEKHIRKEVKPKFKKMLIRKKQETMYEGKYISDISEYVKDKGYYYIEILVEDDGVETKLYLFPTRKESVK